MITSKVRSGSYPPVCYGFEFEMVLNELPELIYQSWKNLLQDTIPITVPEDEFQNWLGNYIRTFARREITDNIQPTQPLIEELFSILQTNGGSRNDFFIELFLLCSAIKDMKLTKDNRIPKLQLNFICNLHHQILTDFTSYMAKLYDDAIEKQEKVVNTTATLLRVTKAASSTLDLESVLLVISNELVRTLDARYCNSFLFPDRSKHGQYFLLGDFPPKGYIVPDPPELFMLDALQRGEPVTCYDAQLDPRTDKNTVAFFGLKSLLAFPLISKGKPIAVGLLCMKDYHHFTQAEIDLVMGIANAAALAVENARYHDSQVQLAIAQERNLLAQELHDRIAQTLAVVKLNLNSILINNPDTSVLSNIQETKSLVDDIYQDVRDGILGLRCLPQSSINSLGDIRDYLSTYGAHHDLEVQFLMNDQDFQVLDGEALLQVGRIIDEAVVNSCKHSKANHVWIKSDVENDKFRVTIEDNGVGIDWEGVNNSNEERFGLKIMRERAEAANGYLTITDRKNGGTCVNLEILIGNKTP